MIEIEDLNYVASKINLDKFKNKTVLLIGSNGFLGNWFKSVFEHLDINFLGYDISEGKNICDPISTLLLNI